MRKIVAVAALFIWAAALRAEDRIWVAAKVNGNPLTFVFDTGSSESALSAAVGRRIGLTNIPALGTTAESDFSIGTNHCRLWFQTAESPDYIPLDFDGILGWNLWRGNIVRLDAETGTIQLLDALPFEAMSWSRFPLSAESILGLQIGSKNHPQDLLIDTGQQSGVALPSESWLRWLRKNRKTPIALKNYWGFWTNRATLTEERWANRIDIGPISLTDEPVQDAGTMNSVANTKHYAGTLGLAALRRLDMIIDGPNRVAYVHPKQTPALPYDHNRSGMGFVPPASNSNRLVIQVVKGGPAYEAGLRNGDVLLTAGSRDIKGLTDFPSSPSERNDPPGTRKTFTTARGSRRVSATVVFRNLIGPAYDPARWYSPVTNDFNHSSVHIVFKPYDVDALIQHASRSGEAGYFDMAIADFSAAINGRPQNMRRDKTNVFVIYCRSWYYLQTRQFAGAITDLTDYLEFDPGNGEAYARRGFAYEGIKDVTNAIKDFTLALRFSPTNAWASYHLGWNYGEIGEYQKAIHFLTDYLKFNPTDAEAYAERGVAYERLMDLTNAIKDLNLALRISPTNTWASYNLGYVYVHTDQFSLAITNLTDYLKSNPNDADVYVQRGFAYTSILDATNAIKDLTRALEFAPKNAFAAYYIGWAYAQTENYKLAVKFEKQALDEGNWPAETRLNIQKKILEYGDKAR